MLSLPKHFVQAGWLAGGDLWEAMRQHRKPRLFGFDLLTGYFGSGKSLGLVEAAERVRLEYGEMVKIYANFNYQHATGMLHHWSEMQSEDRREDASLYLIDEIQLQFDSREWKDFPAELFGQLSQVRKWGQGVWILATAPHSDDVDVRLRRGCRYIIECEAILGGRLCFQSAFRARSYKDHDPDFGPKRERIWRRSFVGWNRLRSCYDTYQHAFDIKGVDPDAELVRRASRVVGAGSSGRSGVSKDLVKALSNGRK